MVYMVFAQLLCANVGIVDMGFQDALGTFWHGDKLKMKEFKYKFKDESLLETALTQSGANATHNNERLEFVGDRVLGLTVAESPILVYCPSKCCRRSSDRLRCTPLLFSARECISSTITYLTPLNFSLNFGATSKIDNVSGVVIRIWGGFLSIFCLWYWEVSPVLTAFLIPKFLPAISSIPFRGSSKFFSMSLSNALIANKLSP